MALLGVALRFWLPALPTESYSNCCVGVGYRLAAPPCTPVEGVPRSGELPTVLLTPGTPVRDWSSASAEYSEAALALEVRRLPGCAVPGEGEAYRPPTGCVL